MLKLNLCTHSTKAMIKANEIRYLLITSFSKELSQQRGELKMIKYLFS